MSSARGNSSGRAAQLADMESERPDCAAELRITLRVYAHWLPEAGVDKGVDRLDDGATARNLSATRAQIAGAGNPRKWLKRRGEPPRNRTGNLQIKSRLRNRK